MKHLLVSIGYVGDAYDPAAATDDEDYVDPGMCQMLHITSDVFVDCMQRSRLVWGVQPLGVCFPSSMMILLYVLFQTLCPHFV